MNATATPQVKDSYDVVVIGGGPAGATIAALLARDGLQVVVFERERFPRFHVGESLLPANMPVFDRLGCHDMLREARFLVKPGATFYDEYEGRGYRTFLFEEIPFRPSFGYNVVRAEFDSLLLQHAAKTGATVCQQCTVEDVQMHPDRVITQVRGPHGERLETRSHLVVDASGRTTFLGSRLGKRKPLPGLGRAAVFAHFRGVHRDTTIPEGNIRIYLVRDGWLWWIPFADGTDSIGCVLHTKVVKQRQGSVASLFDAAIASAPRLAKRLEGVPRLTPVYTASNFSYRLSPAVGNRYLSVGDAAGFVDPIFSTGVFLAMHAAEKAAETIRQAFHLEDFSARRFRKYETQLRYSTKPILAFIRRFYDPAFLDLFFTPRPPPRLYQAVLWVLSGAIVTRRPPWVMTSLRGLFAINALHKIRLWIAGTSVGSRWRW